MIKAGSAQVNITPPVGTILVGQWVARKSVGINDELFANALVIDDGKTRIAFISCDVLAIGNTTKSAIRKLIHKETNIDPENVFMFGTHTHTGPAIVSALGTNADPEYTQQFIKYVAGCVKMANDRLVDADIGIGSGIAEGWAFPRRYWMKDGKVRMHPRKGDSEIDRVQGTSDPQLNVLFVRNKSGNIISVLVNFSCHATVVGGDNVISADYPGAIRDTIKKLLGDDVVVLYGNGACGDVCQINVENPSRSEHGHIWRKRMGMALGCEAVKVISGTDILPENESQIEINKSTLDIPIREIPQDRLESARKAFEGRSLVHPPTEHNEIVNRELLLLAEERAKDPYAHAELFAVKIGNSGIIGIPAELFCELGLKIKSQSKLKPTLVIELANGCVGYIPTEDAFSGGGYETDLARSSKLIPKAGEMVVQKSIELLNS
ncbi:MAG: neutral/alkaline non-lysosomal ceramidase N-terminal domain-containing protein [Candidatus Poribacteria bacterium]